MNSRVSVDLEERRFCYHTVSYKLRRIRSNPITFRISKFSPADIEAGISNRIFSPKKPGSSLESNVKFYKLLDVILIQVFRHLYKWGMPRQILKLYAQCNNTIAWSDSNMSQGEPVFEIWFQGYFIWYSPHRWRPLWTVDCGVVSPRTLDSCGYRGRLCLRVEIQLQPPQMTSIVDVG